MTISPIIQRILRRGVVIPASPLALTAQRKLDERRQRAVWRYYSAAGAGGVAVGVHTTQFAIREPKIGLFRPLLALAAEEFDRLDAARVEPLIRVSGVCGRTEQAVGEALAAHDLGYHAVLLSLGAMRDADDDGLLEHCRKVAEVMPLVGFYLQPAVGGRLLSYRFWRRFLEIDNVVAIKVAPFNRYQTIDVMRAAAESGREDVALYTGNDDSIVLDLVTTYRFPVRGEMVARRFVGGLLGHWSVWTYRAVQILRSCHALSAAEGPFSEDILSLAMEVTDSNAALFDAANGFAGCIAGLHEILRRQGLLEGVWCLDPQETFGPGQLQEIERVCQAYPHLTDDDFVARHRDEWLAD